jgi:hypothetical protein
MKLIKPPGPDDEVTSVRGSGPGGRNLPQVHAVARRHAEQHLFAQLEASAPLRDAGAWLAAKKIACGAVLDMLEHRELREFDLGCISDHWRAGLSIAWGRRE